MAANGPYLIVTVGATGSGKTGLVERVVEYLGEPRAFHKVLIDDVIESDGRYVRGVKDIVQGVQRRCEAECSAPDCVAECEKRMYLNPTAELYQQFSDAYFNSKSSKGCHGKPEFTCSNIADRELARHFSKNHNIVFETTGERYFSWILSPGFTPPNYTVVFAYSLVDLVTLVKRNRTRSFEAIEEFKKDGYTTRAPRLPDVSAAALGTTLAEIQKRLIDLYNKCLLQKPPDVTCGQHPIHKLLLFDNNQAQMLVFDSAVDAPETFAGIIARFFPPSGGRKRRRKTRRVY